MGGQLQMDLSYVTIRQSDGTSFILYREPMYPTHVVKPGPISYYKIPETKEPSSILPSQEICILKRPNHKTNKKWKPKMEYKVGDVVLVDKNPIFQDSWKVRWGLLLHCQTWRRTLATTSQIESYHPFSWYLTLCHMHVRVGCIAFWFFLLGLTSYDIIMLD